MKLHTAVLAALLVAAPAQGAEVFLEGGIGGTFFQPTVSDGIWYQEAFPHQFHTQALAWKAGLGVKLNEHWSVTASYVNLGTVQADTYFVWDGHYDPYAHTCLKECKSPHYLSTTDLMQGPELTATYRYPVGDFAPFLKAGAALMFHTVRASCTTSWGADCSGVDTGLVPMAVVGGGLCYSVVCAEATYYYGFAETGTPIARNAIVPMLTMKLPFSF